MLININADECNPIDNEDIKNKSFKPYESK